MNWDKLVGQWQAVLDAIARLGGRSSELTVDGPASEAEVRALERILGSDLPGSLREVLLTYSKRVHFDWYLPDEFELPEALEVVTCGGLELSLEDIVDAEFRRREWIAEVLAQRDDPDLQSGWDGTLAWNHIISGDLVAFDLRQPGRAPVVTLNHGEDTIDDELGEDFQDFLARWSALGCPGPEPWMLTPYLGSAGHIDCNGATAVLWREALGLKA